MSLEPIPHLILSILCPAAIVTQQRNHAEDKLLLGCTDGTLVRYITPVTCAIFTPVCLILTHRY